MSNALLVGTNKFTRKGVKVNCSLYTNKNGMHRVIEIRSEDMVKVLRWEITMGEWGLDLVLANGQLEEYVTSREALPVTERQWRAVTGGAFPEWVYTGLTAAMRK